MTGPSSPGGPVSASEVADLIIDEFIHIRDDDARRIARVITDRYSVTRPERGSPVPTEPQAAPTPGPQSSADSASVREALELAEDVLSRAPFSTGFWPNGMHPQTGIDKIRDAIRSLSEPQAAPTPGPQSSADSGGRK